MRDLQRGMVCKYDAGMDGIQRVIFIRYSTEVNTTALCLRGEKESWLLINRLTRTGEWKKDDLSDDKRKTPLVFGQTIPKTKGRRKKNA